MDQSVQNRWHEAGSTTRQGGVVHVTMGEYDYVAIAEGPSDEVAMQFLLTLGAGGNVRTTTMKAFTVDGLKKILKKLS